LPAQQQHTLHAVLRINNTHCLRPFPRVEIRILYVITSAQVHPSNNVGK
jgi:hypothetical protein